MCKYTDVYWCLVYISEAHATDEWPIQSARYTPDQKPVCVSQTHDIPTRAKTAHDFVEKYGIQHWPLLIAPPVETESDHAYENFETVYKPWPFRIYGFEGYTIGFISEPRACETHLSELADWLSA